MLAIALLVFTTSSEISPALQVEIDRRVNVLPASSARKARVRKDLEALALNFNGDPKSLPLTRDEEKELAQVKYAVVKRNFHILRHIILGNEIDSKSISNEEFNQHADAYSWMATLEVYKTLQPNEDWANRPQKDQRYLFCVFAKRKLVSIMRATPDDYGDILKVKSMRFTLREILDKMRLKYGRPLTQREVEIILRLRKFEKIAEKNRPEYLAEEMRSILTRSWDYRRSRSLSDDDPVIEDAPDRSLHAEEVRTSVMEDLEKVRSKYKEILVDLARREWATSELAKVKDRPPSTLKSLIHRARLECAPMMRKLMQ